MSDKRPNGGPEGPWTRAMLAIQACLQAREARYREMGYLADLGAAELRDIGIGDADRRRAIAAGTRRDWLC